MPDLGSTEMTMLWLSIALGLVHLAVTATAGVAIKGLPWAAGPRDDPGKPLDAMAGRLDRSFKNFLETFPLFAAAVLVGIVTGKHGALSATGAQMYLWARLIYIPAYLIAIPFLRTLIWAVSLAGIVMVLLAALPGM